MRNENITIKGLNLYECKVFNDIRGSFFEQIKFNDLREIESFNFFQSNISISRKPFTFRGLHFQLAPKAQNKIVQCIAGMVIDIIVDLRENSPSYMKENYIILDSSSACDVLFIPSGCAHGFLTLEANSIVQYYVDNPYSPEDEINYSYNSLTISKLISHSRLIISEKDSNAPIIGGLFND